MKELVITTCPMCGSKRVRKVKRDVQVRRRGQSFMAKGIPVEECPTCGERLFGPASFAAIDEQLHAAKGKQRRKSA